MHLAGSYVVSMLLTWPHLSQGLSPLIGRLQVVEQTIMATGLLVLMGAGLWLVVRDITHLSG